MGIMVAFYFTEETADDGGRGKSAFMAGLMAPSVLLGVVGQPVKAPSADFLKAGPADLPKISSLFIASAHAQPAKPAPGGVRVVALKKDDVAEGYLDGFSAAIGRPNAAKGNVYLYAVGTSDSKDKAIAAAAGINKVMSERNEQFPQAHVLQPDGTNDWVVTLGTLSSPSTALKARQEAQNTAINVLSADGASPAEKATAKLLLEGRTIDANSLFTGK